MKQFEDNGANYAIAEAIAFPLPCPPTPSSPTAPKTTTVTTTTDQYDKIRANSKTLKDQGFTDGLIRSIARSNETFPLRMWVVDNSGSMMTPDGHRIIKPRKNKLRMLDCTRWAEIQDTVQYHARIAALLEAPTRFRLLNDTGRVAGCPTEFSVAERGSLNVAEDLNVAIRAIRTASPAGCTPLAARVQEIAANVRDMAAGLRENGQRAVVVLATDGLPSNLYGQSSRMEREEFRAALRSLEGLPVWVVIRLCTDDDDVVDYYNDLDGQLELSLDVLDDFVAEAKEVYEHNKWLNYALPLHRMREMGFHHKLFDLLDERTLTRDELTEFFFLLYGEDALDSLPDPQIDWQRFLDRIAVVTNGEEKQWNPIKKEMTPWVNIKKLDRVYGGVTCSFSFW